MTKFINPLFLLFSSIPKLIISKVSSISNPLEFKYLIKLFQICWTWQHLQNKSKLSCVIFIIYYKANVVTGPISFVHVGGFITNFNSSPI